MPSHLYPHLNEHQKIYPCQVAGCSRAKNNSSEKKSIRWFHTKDAMVRHMNRIHNLGVQNERNILYNIGLSQETNKQRHLSFTKLLKSSKSNKMPRMFPCQVSGCTRARYESKNETNIHWFPSKMEMVHHLNTEHGVGVRVVQGVRKCISSCKYSDIKSHEIGRFNCDTIDSTRQGKFITLKSETTSPYLPPLSPKLVHCNINSDGDDLGVAEHSETKCSPYLPPLSPNDVSFDDSLDFKFADCPDRLNGVNASISIHQNSRLSKYWLGTEDAFRKDALSSGNCVTLSGKGCSILPSQTDNIKMNIQFAYACAFCDLMESRRELIRKHIWNIHFEWVNDRKMINCLHCPQRSEYLSELAWHVTVCHLLSQDYLEKGYFFYCLECNEKFNDVNSFKQHKENDNCKQKRYGYRHFELSKYDMTKNQINHEVGNTCLLQKSTNLRMYPKQNKCIQKYTATPEEAGKRQKKTVRFLSERNHPSSYAFVSRTNKKLRTEKQKLKGSAQTFWEKYC